MILKNVLLHETVYPCWAYALARIGKKDLLSLDWINDKMPNILETYHNYKDNLSIGDILVWHNSKDEQGYFYSPISIFNKEIIWEKISYKYHACVYEGYGIISDMVKTDGNFDLPFIIRKRRLADLSDPDYVIRFV